MPTLSEVRTKVDDKLAQLWPIIVNKQDTYFSNHGRYWQGILTPSNVIADGIDTDIEPNLRPTDQQESWLDMFEAQLPTKLPMQFQIDTYSSPLGHGFVATVYVKFNNNIYTRSKGIGPEDRDQAWHIVENN